MSIINLIGFVGEQPQIIPRLIPDNAAQQAFDARLDDGGLTPMRMSAKVTAPAQPLNQKTIYLWDDLWIGFADFTYVAPGPVAADRLYCMDGIVPPKLKIKAGSTVTTYPLAVPRPPGAVSLALGAQSPVGDVSTRIYTYTWVTSFGEESEPAPVSPSVDWQSPKTVTLSGFSTPPAGRAIVTRRIYRSQTGTTSGTYFYLIQEESATNGAYVDSIPVSQLQEPLPSASYNAPPDDLTGLISLTNGMMAAFRGRDIFFCEPWRPHAWPEKYVLTVEHDIVALGAVGLTLVVMTKAHPYVIAGSTPASMVMQKIEANLGCINPRGVVDLGYGIAYPSAEGLVLARANGDIGLVTSNIFNRDKWLLLDPGAMIGAQIQNRYVGFYSAVIEGTLSKGAIIVDLTSTPNFLIRTDTYCTAAYFDQLTAALYYQPPDSADLRRVDAPEGARKRLYWKSKQFVLTKPDNFGAMLIDGQSTRTPAEYAAFLAAKDAIIAANNAAIPGDILGQIDGAAMNELALDGDILVQVPSEEMVLTVGIYADGTRVGGTGKLNEAVRLPGGFKARTWEIDVSTNMQLHSIRMAKTMDQIKSGSPD